MSVIFTEKEYEDMCETRESMRPYPRTATEADGRLAEAIIERRAFQRFGRSCIGFSVLIAVTLVIFYLIARSS